MPDTRRLCVFQIDYLPSGWSTRDEMRRTHVAKIGANRHRAEAEARRAFTAIGKGHPEHVVLVASYPLDYIPT